MNHLFGPDRGLQSASTQLPIYFLRRLHESVVMGFGGSDTSEFDIGEAQKGVVPRLRKLDGYFRRKVNNQQARLPAPLNMQSFQQVSSVLRSGQALVVAVLYCL